MRNITAYLRLLEALDLMAESLAFSYTHLDSQDDRDQLARVSAMREAVSAAPVKDPDQQVDDQTLERILSLYEAACRARFFTGSESSRARFRDAANAAEAAAGALYVGGSESWGGFPPS